MTGSVRPQPDALEKRIEAVRHLDGGGLLLSDRSCSRVSCACGETDGGRRSRCGAPRCRCRPRSCTYCRLASPGDVGEGRCQAGKAPIFTWRGPRVLGSLPVAPPGGGDAGGLQRPSCRPVPPCRASVKITPGRSLTKGDDGARMRCAVVSDNRRGSRCRFLRNLAGCTGAGNA